MDFRNQRVKKALYTEFEPNRDTPQYVILRCYELVTRKRGKIPPQEVDFRNQRVKKALYTEFEPNRDTPQYVILRCYELVNRKRGKIPPQRGGFS